MSLAVCLIVKNEERCIGRALGSFSGVADEMIVVDTGSTDRSIQIARDAGARVLSFPWIDDFGAARNFAIDHATTDWIFVLDADEELLPRSRSHIGRCLKTDDALGYWILRQDLHYAGNNDLFTEMWMVRLFRRRDDLRFIGRCHPDFRPSLAQRAALENKRVYLSDVVLRHDGYVGEEMRAQKLRRGLRLIELERRDRPGQLYYDILYGRSLLQVGDDGGHALLREAWDKVLETRAQPDPPITLVAALLEYQIVTPKELSGCQLPLAEIHALARQWFPSSAPLLWLRGQWEFQAGDYEAATQSLEKLLHLARTRTYEKSTEFNPRILGDDLLLNLGVCHTRLANLDRAEQHFESLLQSPTLREQANQNLALVRSLRAQFS